MLKTHLSWSNASSPGLYPGLAEPLEYSGYAGRTEGIYPRCQSLSGMLVCTPLDCNELWTTFTNEQRRMGPHRRGRGQRGCTTWISPYHPGKSNLGFHCSVQHVYLYYLVYIPNVLYIIIHLSSVLERGRASYPNKMSRPVLWISPVN